jgi:hypothetical protein
MTARASQPGRSARHPRNWGIRELMDIEDEDKAEMDRLDPKDVFGYISLGCTIFNVIYSTTNSLYTFDWLISTSLILGLISFAHKRSWAAGLSLGLLGLHLATIGILRLAH